MRRGLPGMRRLSLWTLVLPSALLCFGFMPGQAQNAVRITWERQAAPAGWSARDSAGEVVFQGKMWILGGYTPGRVNDVWASADGVKWEQITPKAPWPARNLPGSVVHQGRMWILGGAQSVGKVSSSLNDVWSSADGKHWEAATLEAPWKPRTAAGVFVFDDQIWVTGGFDASDYRHYGDVWRSADGKNWTQVTANAPWADRSMHGALVFADRMWIIGGGEYNSKFPQNTKVDYNDVWSSLDGKKWTRVTDSAPWTARRFHSALVYDGEMWVIGGYHRGNRNDVWHSSDGKNWTEAKSDPIWSVRHEPMCLVFQDRLWLMGGFGRKLFRDVWTLSRRQ